MKVKDRIIELRRVKACELLPNPRNWRTHPEAQQNAMRGILAEVGIADAVLARETPDGLMLIDGHLRAEIDPETEWPVLVLDVTEAEADKILATHDPLAAMATVDAVQLDALLRDVETGSQDIADMLEKLAEDAGLYLDDKEPAEIIEDEVPEPPAEPITKPGDLWVLGDHRVLCGDSTKAEDVERLMAGTKAELISTDPPYGVDFVGAKYCPTAKKWDAIANDKRQGDNLREWLAEMWRVWLKHCDERSSFYSWCAAMEEGGAAAAAMRDAGIHIQSQIIWVKNALVLGQADYQWRHENCWYGFLKGKKHRWYGGRAQTTVWEIKKVSNSDYVHPMQKPVSLYAIAIENHTKQGDVVAEPFCGSGSQVIAAEQLGRKCFGMEISPQYTDVIVARWEKLTGRKAELA